MAATNSHLILSDIDGEWKNRHRDFSVKLAWSLVLNSVQGLRWRTEERATRPANGGNFNISLLAQWREPRAQRGSSVHGYVSELSATNGFALAKDGSYLPLRVPYAAKRDCFYCRLKIRQTEVDIARHKTAFRCVSCDIFLCLERERNCFSECHRTL